MVDLCLLLRTCEKEDQASIEGKFFNHIQYVNFYIRTLFFATLSFSVKCPYEIVAELHQLWVWVQEVYWRYQEVNGACVHVNRMHMVHLSERCMCCLLI